MRFVPPDKDDPKDTWVGTRLVQWVKRKCLEISTSVDDFTNCHAEVTQALQDLVFALSVTDRAWQKAQVPPAPTPVATAWRIRDELDCECRSSRVW